MRTVAIRTVAPTLLTTMLEPLPTFPRKRLRRRKILNTTVSGGDTMRQGQPT
jgi:hypothetical protein